MLRCAIILLLLAACSRPVPAKVGTGGSGAPVEICDNRVDDDGNGLVDCADPACTDGPRCPACGDGLKDPREACEAADLGGHTCESLGFDGGRLACTSDCQLETRGCTRLEDCSTRGDEDGNGKADCADPVCAERAECLTVSVWEAPERTAVSSRIELAFRAADGGGQPLVATGVTLDGPASAGFPGTSLTDGDGVARFRVRMGRLPGLERFTAHLDSGASVDRQVVTDELEPGTIATVLDGDRVAGSDDAGAAVGAHAGAPIAVQVASDGTLYVAEACRVLAISPEGVLSRLAGTGTCGSAPVDADPLTADMAVASIALDDKRGVLYLSDPGAELVRALDLRTGAMTVVAGGGSIVGSAGDGGPARLADLTPGQITMAPDGRLVLRDGNSKTFRAVDLATGTIATVFPSGCCSTRCAVTFDGAGAPFVSGDFCSDPGVVRFDGASSVRVAGRTPGAGPDQVMADLAQLESVTAAAFDGAGDLLLLTGRQLFRVESSTGWLERIAGGEDGFSGEGTGLAGALFHDASAMAFGPGGDLYVADTGNGALRRIAALPAGAPGVARVVSGDGQQASFTMSLANPLRFQISDAAGRPVPSAQVAVTADPDLLVTPPGRTDADGETSLAVTVPLRAGSYQVAVRPRGIHASPTGTPAVFSVEAVEPPPGTLFTAAGAGATMPDRGRPVPAPFSHGEFRRVAIAPDGSLYLATQIQVLHLNGDGRLELVAGSGGQFTQGLDGPALDADFDITDIAFDGKGRLLVADPSLVRAIDLSTGLIDGVLAGPGSGNEGDGDGGLATDATFDTIESIGVEPSGAIDLGSFGSVWVVRRVDPTTGIVSSLVSPPACGAGAIGPNAWVGTLAPMGADLWMVAGICGLPDPNAYRLVRRDGSGVLTIFDEPAFCPRPEKDGTLLTCLSSGVARFDPATGRSTLLVASLPNGPGNEPVALARDAAGHLWIVDNYYMVRVLW